MTKPFFSIVIPTCNRADHLKIAIKSVLSQDYENFEIIISDNHSSDNTKQVVCAFNDPRITYLKRNKLVPLPNNVIRGILAAKGKYIITLGDDDVILFPNTLSYLHNLLQKKKYGFLRLNYLSKNMDNTKISVDWIKQRSKIAIKPNTKSLSIISFFEKINGVFLSGLIFLNKRVKKNDFISSEISCWISLAHRLIKKHGAIFIPNHYIIASWSSSLIPSEINKLYSKEKHYQYYFANHFLFITEKLLNKKDSLKYQTHFFNNFEKNIYSFFLSLKYFTDNSFISYYHKQICILNKKLKKNYWFLFYYCLTYCLPKSFISFIRLCNNRMNLFYLKNINHIKNIKEINKRYQQLFNTL